jgi:hypothetical protein
MTAFTYEADDKIEVPAIGAAREAYNANNPQNLQATDQDFFNLINSSQFAQWAAANVKQVTVTAPEFDAMAQFVDDAKKAGVQNVDQMVELLGRLQGQDAAASTQ